MLKWSWFPSCSLFPFLASFWTEWDCHCLVDLNTEQVVERLSSIFSPCRGREGSKVCIANTKKSSSFCCPPRHGFVPLQTIWLDWLLFLRNGPMWPTSQDTQALLPALPFPRMAITWPLLLTTPLSSSGTCANWRTSKRCSWTITLRFVWLPLICQACTPGRQQLASLHFGGGSSCLWNLLCGP